MGTRSTKGTTGDYRHYPPCYPKAGVGVTVDETDPIFPVVSVSSAYPNESALQMYMSANQVVDPVSGYVPINFGATQFTVGSDLTWDYVNHRVNIATPGIYLYQVSLMVSNTTNTSREFYLNHGFSNVKQYPPLMINQTEIDQKVSTFSFSIPINVRMDNAYVYPRVRSFVDNLTIIGASDFNTSLSISKVL